MSLDVTVYQVEIELLEDMLGTVPKNREVYASYIAAKGREMLEKQAKKGIPLANGAEGSPIAVAEALAEEVETIEEVEEKGWTGFHTDHDGPFVFNYLIKGNLCAGAGTLKERGLVKQLKDKFKRYVFVKPRRIRLPDVSSVNERPLQAMTAQGPRVTVTRSDVVPAGTKLSFQIEVVPGGGITKAILQDVLAYGEYVGLGQWRSGSWGSYKLLRLEEE